jgi:hypothetical protein
MTTTITATSTPKCVCKSCGKQGFCKYEEQVNMSYCPTFIRKRIDVKKTLTNSPFKVLSSLHISPKK